MIIDKVSLIKEKMYRKERKMREIEERRYWMEIDDDDFYDMMAHEQSLYEELASQLLDLFE